MANTAKRFYSGKPGTIGATIYNAPANTTSIIKNMILVNTTNTDSVVTIQIVGFDFISSYTVKARDTVVLDLSFPIVNGEAIVASQLTTSAINVFISGVEVA